MPLPRWVADYARRRYGPNTPDSALRAWQLLLESVYNATDCHTDHSRGHPHQPTRSERPPAAL